jgi:Family of unknown function (DUF6152)
MKVLAISAIGIVLTVGPALAHHPFASEFDANQPVRLTGKVTQVNWGNPHVIIQMTAEGAANGQNWNLEVASPADLLHKGWARDSVKPGDEIVVEGYRAKSEPMTAAARLIELRSGQKLQAADDQDGGPKSPPIP